MKNQLCYLILPLFFLFACSADQGSNGLKAQLESDPNIPVVKEKALEMITTGFNAGDSYAEVWIRDYNTFIELAMEVHDHEDIKENIRIFFRFQDDDGGIVDGFRPYQEDAGGYDYIYSDLEPDLMAHKNTVETDHESSLIQTVYKYVKRSGDTAFLDEEIDGMTIAERMLFAVEFLMNERMSDQYGLLWGATTADWGDVQPEHEWGVYLTEDTHYAVEVYDNALFLIALENLAELLPEQADYLNEIHEMISSNIMEHLWDEENGQFVPHRYLDGSPFPDDFNEDEIYQHGGTAVAIEAGLLSNEQIYDALQRMRQNVEAANAATIGLTLYPPYPEGFFLNPGMYPYGYQNGGDWTWFGGRMIQQLIRHGFVEEAYIEAKPMFERVIENDGFYEWYTPENEPMGSGTFRGSAGVLFTAIELFEEWAENQ
jgi:glycogen debranching enzyme